MSRFTQTDAEITRTLNVEPPINEQLAGLDIKSSQHLFLIPWGLLNLTRTPCSPWCLGDLILLSTDACYSEVISDTQPMTVNEEQLRPWPGGFPNSPAEG